MKRCEECGKELKFYEGYRHPILGKKFLLCSPCFDVVYEDLALWKEFVINHIDLFKNGYSHDKYQLNMEKITPGYTMIYDTFISKYVNKEFTAK